MKLLLAWEAREALTADQRSALMAIVDAPEAWISSAALERLDVAGDTIDELLVHDLVVRWTPEVGPARRENLVTLSTWGAYVLAVEIDERTRVEAGVAIEVPFWVGIGKGSDCVVLPKHARECRLPFPERVPDPASEPDPTGEAKYLLDEWSGKPVAIWGVPVVLDRPQRLRRA